MPSVLILRMILGPAKSAQRSDRNSYCSKYIFCFDSNPHRQNLRCRVLTPMPLKVRIHVHTPTPRRISRFLKKEKSPLSLFYRLGLNLVLFFPSPIVILNQSLGLSTTRPCEVPDFCSIPASGCGISGKYDHVQHGGKEAECRFHNQTETRFPPDEL